MMPANPHTHSQGHAGSHSHAGAPDHAPGRTTFADPLGVGYGDAPDLCFRSAIVELGVTRCFPTHSGLTPERNLRAPIIGLPLYGVFALHRRGQTAMIASGFTAFGNPGQPFRCSHPGAIGDECTWLAPSQALLADVLKRHAPRGLDNPDNPFDWLSGPIGEDAFLLHRALALHLRRTAGPDAIFVEETAVRLLDLAVAGAAEAAGARKHRPRESTRRAHDDLVQNVHRVLATRFSERLTISDIAKAVHSSPYNLCRIYKAGTGVTIHAQLLRTRSHEALIRLLDDVPAAEAAAASGFSSHSHMCDAFREVFGTPPIRLRDDVRAASEPAPPSAPAPQCPTCHDCSPPHE